MARKNGRSKTASRASLAPTDRPTSQEAAPSLGRVAKIKRFQKARREALKEIGFLDDGGKPGRNKKEIYRFLLDFNEDDPLPSSMDVLKGVVLDLNRAEGLVELQRDNTIRAELQTCANWLRDSKQDIAFDLVARGETTNQDLEELYKRWLKGNGPTQSESTSRPRLSGGRPRKDDERKKVLDKRKAGKVWKDVQKELNEELKQNKSVDAYRALLRMNPSNKSGQNVQN